jgi:hypothetical protein
MEQRCDNDNVLAIFLYDKTRMGGDAVERLFLNQRDRIIISARTRTTPRYDFPVPGLCINDVRDSIKRFNRFERTGLESDATGYTANQES